MPSSNLTARKRYCLTMPFRNRVGQSLPRGQFLTYLWLGSAPRPVAQGKHFAGSVLNFKPQDAHARACAMRSGNSSQIGLWQPPRGAPALRSPTTDKTPSERVLAALKPSACGLLRRWPCAPQKSEGRCSSHRGSCICHLPELSPCKAAQLIEHVLRREP